MPEELLDEYRRRRALRMRAIELRRDLDTAGNGDIAVMLFPVQQAIEAWMRELRVVLGEPPTDATTRDDD